MFGGWMDRNKAAARNQITKVGRTGTLARRDRDGQECPDYWSSHPSLLPKKSGDESPHSRMLGFSLPPLGGDFQSAMRGFFEFLVPFAGRGGPYGPRPF